MPPYDVAYVAHSLAKNVRTSSIKSDRPGRLITYQRDGVTPLTHTFAGRGTAELETLFGLLQDLVQISELSRQVTIEQRLPVQARNQVKHLSAVFPESAFR
jgi:hypothetical protein